MLNHVLIPTLNTDAVMREENAGTVLTTGMCGPRTGLPSVRRTEMDATARVDHVRQVTCDHTLRWIEPRPTQCCKRLMTEASAEAE